MSRPIPRLLAALGPDAAGPADADLLARFADRRDAGAFELLVRRHAPLVLRVCRAALRDRHAAEDCAQAVFLALARQAGSVRGGTLPGWLFRVSRRVTARATRRRPLPPANADPDTLPAPEATPGPESAEVRALHDELTRRPDTYRVPLLLAYFEGLTYPEVARRLGWPVGTVTGRVARAKAVLGVRLARRGLAPSMLMAGVEPLPPAFAGTTAVVAAAYATGHAGKLPGAVAGLAAQELRRVAMAKCVKVAGAALAVGAVAVGLGAAWGNAPPPPAPAQAPPVRTPDPVVRIPFAPEPPPKVWVEEAFFAAPVTTALQRLLLRGTAASRAVVWVDGSALLRGTSAQDLLAITGALEQFREGPGRPVAHLMVLYPRRPEPTQPDPTVRDRRLLEHALEGAAARAGYAARPVLTAVMPEGFSLAARTAPLRDWTGWDADEPGVGDGRARAYPVRTPLSRVLTHSADGVIEVRAGANDQGEVERSVRTALAALDLPRGRKVDYLLDVRNEDESRHAWVRGLLRKAVEARGLALGDERRPLG